MTATGASRYTTFSLYWQQWGGYPERSQPFGPPSITCIVASNDFAARCTVTRESRTASDVVTEARWTELDRQRLAPLPSLLEEAGAFGQPKALVESDAGDYVCEWNLSGVWQNRPFQLVLTFHCPGAVWTPLGERLRTALEGLRDASADAPLATPP